MKHWPLSAIVHNPSMPSVYLPELRQVYANFYISHGAFKACGNIAMKTTPVCDSLVVIESIGAPVRRVYTEYPDFEDWFQLERGGFVQGDDGFFRFIVDALH